MSRPRFDHEHAVEAPSSVKPGDTRCMACRAASHKNCRSKSCTCDDERHGRSPTQRH